MKKAAILSKTLCLEKVFEIDRHDELLFISIQPRFSELIRIGSKTVELRKKKPKLISKFAMIYESSPKQTVSFLIKIKKIDAAPKSVIWKRYRKKCCISKKYFNEYYKGSKHGVAILIEKVVPLGKEVSRKILAECNLLPPQDYRYASKQEIMNIMRC